MTAQKGGRLRGVLLHVKYSHILFICPGLQFSTYITPKTKCNILDISHLTVNHDELTNYQRLPFVFTDIDSNRKSCKYFSTVVPRQFLQRTQDHQETTVHHVVQWYVSVILVEKIRLMICFISIHTTRTRK